jgi:hypothetical protein
MLFAVMCILLGRVLVLHAVVASVCVDLTIPASGCKIMTHSYIGLSKDGNDYVTNKTVSMSLSRPDSKTEMDALQVCVGRTFLKHLREK